MFCFFLHIHMHKSACKGNLATRRLQMIYNKTVDNNVTRQQNKKQTKNGHIVLGISLLTLRMFGQSLWIHIDIYAVSYKLMYWSAQHWFYKQEIHIKYYKYQVSRSFHSDTVWPNVLFIFPPKMMDNRWIECCVLSSQHTEWMITWSRCSNGFSLMVYCWYWNLM